MWPSAAVKALAFSPAGRSWPPAATTGTSGCGTSPPRARRRDHGDRGARRGPGVQRGRTTLATAETDGATELWAFATQQQTGAALAAQGSGGVSALAFSPSANALAAGDGNGTIELWNPASFHQSSAPIAIGTPESPAAAAGHPPAVLSVRGDILAVSDGRGTVRLWNAWPGARTADRSPAITR